ncbi:MAG: HAD hydrolase-like protein [Myxococcota bacterium]
MADRLEDILARYDVFLFDAYGVLVHAAGALPGAKELLTRLCAEGREFWVITNDASRTPATCAHRYRQLGLPVEEEQVISSGALLPAWYKRAARPGAPTIVLGPPDAHAMVEAAGGLALTPAEALLRGDVEVVALCDEAFEPFVPMVDDTLSAIVRAVAHGRTPKLVVPNPDLIYPRGDGGFGVTTGAVAEMIEAALRVRMPEAPRFERLGKPHPPIFEEVRARAIGKRLVMFGDTLETDIHGATQAGIDSVLVLTGVSGAPGEDAKLRPTFVLDSLRSQRAS